MLNSFLSSSGMEFERCEKANSLLFIYRWMGVLSPFLYLTFAMNFSADCKDVQFYLELVFSFGAGLNVIDNCSKSLSICFRRMYHSFKLSIDFRENFNNFIQCEGLDTAS